MHPNVLSMKYLSSIILLSNILFFNFQSFSESKDSLYIKINDVNPKIISILLSDKGRLSDKGNISIISISMKNKYENVFRFGCDPYAPPIFKKDKKKINLNNLITYNKLNKILDEDFLKTLTNYEVFFILTEDKNSFYSIKVMPLLPPKLNKM